MRAILTIALTQLQTQLRERGSLITLFGLPIIMTIILGGAFNGSSAPQIVDVVRPPADDLAGKFVDLLRAEGQKAAGGTQYVVCDLAVTTGQPAECKLPGTLPANAATLAAQRLDAGSSQGSVMLPATFAADLRGGKNVQVTVSTKNNITTQQALTQLVDAVNSRLGGSILAARTVAAKENGDATVYNNVYNAAEAVWDKDPVQIDQQSSTVTGTAAGSGYGQSAPGIGAMFVLINALTLAELFITERRYGTLQRMLVLPLSRAQILAGKLLGQFLLGMITFGVMLVVGAVFGVHWGDGLAAIVVVLAYVLAVTAMGLAFSTLVRSGGQATAGRLLLSMLLAALGGAWWTLSIVPSWMRSIGQISPIYWSQDAFGKLIFYGAHLPDVLPSVLVLLGFAVVFFLIGVSRFKYE